MYISSWEDVSQPRKLISCIVPPGLGSDGGEETLPAFPCIKKLSVSNLQSIVETAHTIGIEPDWLATIIDFETGGTCSTTQKNAAGSGATGLIQFMPKTAQNLLGTSTPEEAVQKLEAMSFPEQMKLVERYFAPHAGKMKSLSDAYLAVLYPAFIGASDDAVMGRTGSAIYTQNAGFDSAHKGYITKADITSRINAMLDGMKERVATGIPLVASSFKLKLKPRPILTGIAIVAAAGVVAWGMIALTSRRSAPIQRRQPATAT
jgi:hypothetical protein